MTVLGTRYNHRMAKERTFDTRLIHAGEPSPRMQGAIAMPVFQSSTFEDDGSGSYDAIRYARLSNTPNHMALHSKLASLEGGQAGLVTASGMAAISTTLLSVLSPGDHLIAQRCLYGGTFDFIKQTLARLGIATTFVDGEDPGAWEAARRPTTKAIYVEAMTNPLLEVADLSSLARFASRAGLTSIIDSTFAPPVMLRPIALGFDVVVHSATKYLNGHSDLCAGAIVGSQPMVDEIRHLLNHLGGSLDPHACFLLHRGLKTLSVRVRRQSDSALQVAAFVAAHPAVQRVAYPGLRDHPSHGRAAELFDRRGGFGGMLAFELRGQAPAAVRAIAAMQLFARAPSLGGPESLVTLPAVTSHAGMAAAERRALGIADGLVRLSIGLEDPADLIDDLRGALDSVG